MSLKMMAQIATLEKRVEELEQKIETLAPVKPAKTKGRKEGTLHLNG